MRFASLVAVAIFAGQSQVETIITNSAIIASSVAGLILAIRQASKPKRAPSRKVPSLPKANGRAIHRETLDSRTDSE